VIVYSFYSGTSDTAEFFPPLRAAERRARELLKWMREEGSSIDGIDIERVEIVPLTKANVIDILATNGGAYSSSTKIVKVIS